MGFEGFDIQPLKDFVEALGYELHIKETFISQIVFDIRKEKSPCSLCANLRRGKIIAYAKELGCNKLAYGHHLDDGIETFFMNLFFAGKLGVFTPGHMAGPFRHHGHPADDCGRRKDTSFNSWRQKAFPFCTTLARQTEKQSGKK